MSTALEILAAIDAEVAAHASVTVWMDLATLQVPAVIWLERTYYARALLCAHMGRLAIAIEDAGAAAALGAGPITSRSAGDLSESYGSAASISGLSSGDALLTGTVHGQQFLALRAGLAASAPFVLNLGGYPT